MIFSHIIANILFWIFLYITIMGLKQNKKNLKNFKFVFATIIIGSIMYILYLIMLISGYKESGFDTQSFSILILSWAFENSAYCIINKKNYDSTVKHNDFK